MENGKRELMSGVNYELFDIIDGQQRITTVLILLSEIFEQMKGLGSVTQDNIQILKDEWLRFRSQYKLELLGDDREFFRRYLIDGEELHASTLTASQSRLNRAKIFFRGKFNELKKQKPTEHEKLLTSFVSNIDEMEVMVYPLEKTVEAARMFELVNDRGKDLTNLEKTKSYLMYMIYLVSPSNDQERHLRDLNDRFGNIYRWIVNIQDTVYGKELDEDDIQRYHFITYAPDSMIPLSTSRSEASNDYNKVLKNHIIAQYRSNKAQCLATVLSYIKDLENSFTVFKEIFSYNSDDLTKALP